MLQKIALNKKKYFLSSFFLWISALLFAKNLHEGIFISLGYLLIVLNYHFFIKGLSGIFEEYFSDNTGFNKSKIVPLFLRKLFFLMGIFFLSVHFLGSKVIIIVALYLLQTIVLVYAKEG